MKRCRSTAERRFISGSSGAIDEGMESRPCEAHEVGAPALVATLVNDIALEKEQAG